MASQASDPRMALDYLFIVIYCFLEKWLARGDYRREKRDLASSSYQRKLLGPWFNRLAERLSDLRKAPRADD